jgi:capsular polysaccharide transport system permease protein
MQFIRLLGDHARIIWALMLRELATRYGRDNLGFLWVIFEPLMFCGAVLILWRSIRGPYENGLGIVPFIMTGYMPTILVRHIVMYSMNAVKMNAGLLYHKSITVLDLYSARIMLEFIGVTLAFFIITMLALTFGFAHPPQNLGLFYEGWFTTGLIGAGFGLVLGAISEIVEVVERIVGVALYILVPLSGTFYLADWLPSNVRELALLVPFLDCSEMVRGGFFGPSVHPHYHEVYTLGCALVMLFFGLLLVRHIRDRIELP